MTRALHLNRDQAECLDDILLEYVAKNQSTGFDIRMIDVAEELRKTWAWSRWDKRQNPQVTTEDYDRWVQSVMDWLTDIG